MAGINDILFYLTCILYFSRNVIFRFFKILLLFFSSTTVTIRGSDKIFILWLKTKMLVISPLNSQFSFLIYRHIKQVKVVVGKPCIPIGYRWFHMLLIICLGRAQVQYFAFNKNVDHWESDSIYIFNSCFFTWSLKSILMSLCSIFHAIQKLKNSSI